MMEKLFLQMKDTSELMLDLAYSALLYNNEQIAKELFLLEETMDDLYKQIQEDAVRSVLKDKNVGKALVMIRLATSIETVVDSALEIADVVLRGIEPHPVFKQMIEEADVSICRAEVRKKLENTLGKLKLASKTGMWIIAIKRGKEWTYGPDEYTVIKQGDVLIARGPIEGENELKKLIG